MEETRPICILCKWCDLKKFHSYDWYCNNPKIKKNKLPSNKEKCCEKCANNTYYTKIATEDYSNSIDFDDFLTICDTLKLPVFETKVVLNPCTDNLNERKTLKTYEYESIRDYRKIMPEWSAREYDYIKDRPLHYRTFEGIEEGNFIVNDSNKSTSYRWHFQVLEECIVVHSVVWFTD